MLTLRSNELLREVPHPTTRRRLLDGRASPRRRSVGTRTRTRRTRKPTTEGRRKRKTDGRRRGRRVRRRLSPSPRAGSLRRTSRTKMTSKWTSGCPRPTLTRPYGLSSKNSARSGRRTRSVLLLRLSHPFTTFSSLPPLATSSRPTFRLSEPASHLLAAPLAALVQPLAPHTRLSVMNPLKPVAFSGLARFPTLLDLDCDERKKIRARFTAIRAAS